MGTWGSGNFDSDAAGETADAIRQEMEDVITRALLRARSRRAALDEAESEVMVRVALLVAMAEAGTATPEPELIVRWRDAYLHLYEHGTAEWGVEASFIAERRRVIERTFATLLALSERYHARVATPTPIVPPRSPPRARRRAHGGN